MGLSSNLVVELTTGLSRLGRLLVMLLWYPEVSWPLICQAVSTHLQTNFFCCCFCRQTADQIELKFGAWTHKAPVTHSLQPVGDPLATKISSGRRGVAGRLQGGRRPVAEVAGTIRSQGGFGCCKWNLSATKSIVERFLVVADGLPTDRRPVAAVVDNPDTVFSHRSVADRSPKSCRLSAIINKRSRYSRRPIANWLPIAPQLIADGSATTVRLHDSIV